MSIKFLARNGLSAPTDHPEVGEILYSGQGGPDFHKNYFLAVGNGTDVPCAMLAVEANQIVKNKIFKHTIFTSDITTSPNVYAIQMNNYQFMDLPLYEDGIELMVDFARTNASPGPLYLVLNFKFEDGREIRDANGNVFALNSLPVNRLTRLIFYKGVWRLHLV